ncbi:MAG: fumarylacetoacetate hydrolase family protein [Pseudomonadota bacterium]
MKLRRVLFQNQYRIQALVTGTWRSLDQLDDLSDFSQQNGVESDLASDLLAVLQLSADEQDDLLSRLISVEGGSMSSPDAGETFVCLPFSPASFRDFMLYEQHVIDSTRGYVKRFMPGMYKVTSVVERVTGKPFRKFRPAPLWYRQPIYYLSNHLNFAVSGADVAWPKYTAALDYELELGAVLARPLYNASAEEAEAAVGGFFVLNDFSARDVQKDEMESGFGPQKAKHFCSTMSATVISADKVWPIFDDLVGSVAINDVEVSTCTAAGAQYSLCEAIAFASKGEQLHPGEVFGTGTLPGGSGMESGHWLNDGDKLRLSIDEIGVVENTVTTAN